MVVTRWMGGDDARLPSDSLDSRQILLPLSSIEGRSVSWRRDHASWSDWIGWSDMLDLVIIEDKSDVASGKVHSCITAGSIG